jgi:DNA-binding NarL/FixJ family response regulator
MPSTTTLIVADDHPLFRAALREAVAHVLPETQIVEAGSVAAVEHAAQVHPDADLILLDLYMPDAHGFSALAHLRATFPSIPVAIISAAESASIVRRAMDFGASGFIPKSASIERIGAMLRALLSGELAVPPEYRESESDSKLDADRDIVRTLDRLTPQQLRVFLLLAEGSSNKAIAQDLGVSEATVKAHVTVILRKLKLERRTQAALLAQRLLGVDAVRARMAGAGERDAAEA